MGPYLGDAGQGGDGTRRACVGPAAAALDLCYVAAGRLDGFWETGLCVLGYGGGIALIIREAGGIVSGLDGSENLPR